MPGGENLRKLKNYTPTRFMAENSHYDKDAADFAVMFIESLCHTKGTWAGKKFELIDWQERIIRDLFGVLKPNGYRQFNTAYVEIPKKQGKSELAAAVALLLCCGDGEERAEVYGCAADRQQRMCRHRGKKNLLQGIFCRDPSIPAFLHTQSLAGDGRHDILCLNMPGSIFHGDQHLKGMKLICRKADDRVIERQEMLAAEPGFFRVEFLNLMTIQHIEN